jgi:hypothetical protein
MRKRPERESARKLLDERRYSMGVTPAQVLLLVLFGVIAAFALAEAAIRLSPFDQVQFYRYDRDRGWALREGAAGWQRKEGIAYVQVNSQGLRGSSEYTIPKPAGVYRVAVIGDSYTEARQVSADQNYCAVMRESLRQCRFLAGRRIEVLNFGVDGYNTAQELLTLREQAWGYSPDFVVLEVFPGNDVKENSLLLESDRCRPFPLVQNGRMTLGGPFMTSSWFRFHCWMRFESRHFQVLNLLGAARKSVSRTWNREWTPAPKGSELGINPTVYKKPTDPGWKEGWQATEAAVATVHAEVMRHGAGFLVIIPSISIQVSPDRKARERFTKAIGVTDLFYPDNRLLALGVKHDFAVLDLSRPLRDFADTRNAAVHGFTNTKPGYGHWNAQAHRVAGELIAARICAQESRRARELARRTRDANNGADDDGCEGGPALLNPAGL